MLRKAIPLATAVAMLIIFPSSLAQGETGIQWTHKGSKLAKDATIELTGSMSFSAILGGIACPIAAEITLTRETSTALVNSFKIANTGQCQLSGIYAECEVLSGHEYTKLPWQGTGSSTGKISLTAVTFHTTFKAKAGHNGCPPKITFESTATAIPLLTLNSTTGATKATLSGSLTFTGPASEDLGVTTLSGVLNILEPNSGTYGIG